MALKWKRSFDYRFLWFRMEEFDICSIFFESNIMTIDFFVLRIRYLRITLLVCLLKYSSLYKVKKNIL